MKKLPIVLIILCAAFLSQGIAVHSKTSLCVNGQEKTPPAAKGDSIIKNINGNKIILVSEKESSSTEFEPRYTHRRIIINNTYVIDVDSLCQLKSKLFNPSYNFYSSSISLVKKGKQCTRVKIFLGQTGCSGDFCQDLIVFDIRIVEKKISMEIYDNK